MGNVALRAEWVNSNPTVIARLELAVGIRSFNVVVDRYLGSWLID